MFCKMYVKSTFSGMATEVDISGLKTEVESVLAYYASTGQLIGFKTELGIYSPKYINREPEFTLAKIGATLRGLISPQFKRGQNLDFKASQGALSFYF